MAGDGSSCPPACWRCATAARTGPRWVDRLPALARDLLEEWELTLDGALMHGFCSLVVPVLTADGQRAVLKLHTDADADESDFEHLALQHWHGNGTVLLLRADPRRRAMLLERLHPRDLDPVGDLEACEVVAGLYGRIHVPALPQLRTLTSYVERWTDDLDALPRDAPIPRRHARAVRVAGARPGGRPGLGRRDHPRRPAPPERAGRRPRALAGDRPQADERRPALRAGADALEPLGRASSRATSARHLRRRFHTLVDAAGLDEDRARDWVVVRMVHNASWAVIDGDPDEDYLTMCFTIAKAVQD